MQRWRLTAIAHGSAVPAIDRPVLNVGPLRLILVQMIIAGAKRELKAREAHIIGNKLNIATWREERLAVDCPWPVV